MSGGTATGGRSGGAECTVWETLFEMERFVRFLWCIGPRSRHGAA